MDTIDDIGRRAAAAVRADADAVTDADVDAMLESLAEAAAAPRRTTSRRGPGRPPRRWAVLGAAAAVAAAVVAGVVVVANREPHREVVPSPSVPPSPVPTSPLDTEVPSSTAPTTSVPPSTEPAATPPPSTGEGLAVSYKDPPPFLEPQLLGNVELTDAELGNGITVMESGVVVLDGTTVTVLQWDGTTRSVELRLDFEFSGWIVLAAGPGDVLYAAATGVDQTNLAAATIVAIPLSGERAGQVVATTPADVNKMIERPAGWVGHGPFGIVDREGLHGQLAEYVDDTGTPLSDQLAIPEFRKDGDTITSFEGTSSWSLQIERAPNSGGGFVGEAPPAPAPGGAVWWDTIGPPASGGDYPPRTIPVIAFLASDGTATWRQIPDGWGVAAADVWGTVLIRLNGTRAELALATTTAASTAAPSAAEQAVTDYLTALAARDYDAAAVLLGNDGLSLSERPDLAVIRDAMGLGENLAEALREWCEGGPYRAACWMPSGVAEAEPTGLDTGDSTVVVARYEGFSASFRVNAWEGQPSVYGLPPLTVDALPAARELVGVHAMYADDPTDRRLVMASVTGAEGLQRPAADADPIGVTPDGYAITWATGEPTRSTVTDTNGAVLCSAGDRILQVLGEPGAYRAVVVREGEVGPPAEPAPQPSFEIDCQSGVETPTDPWAWNGGPTYRTRIRVGGRDFFVSGSDHGAQLENNAGSTISGEDTIMTTPSFSADGSVVTYGALSGSANPWLATRVVARDTSTGEVVWETDVNAPVSRTWTTDALIVVDIGVTDNPLDGMSALAVLDPATGEVQLTVPAAFDLVHVR